MGRYTGIVHRELAGSERDYLVLEYAKGDKLYVPSDAVGWSRATSAATCPVCTGWAAPTGPEPPRRSSVRSRDMAGELVRLYTRADVGAGLRLRPGHAVAAASSRTRSRTRRPPISCAAIEDVKRDMEPPVPMDRLLCGDVGFGKTEVAVRAAFKAVMGGKQVAVLVPTTLLAEQHFMTFRERFAPFPVTVAMLSRFVDAAEQERRSPDLAAGKVDVVIGTHRLLQQRRARSRTSGCSSSTRSSASASRTRSG